MAFLIAAIVISLLVILNLSRIPRRLSRQRRRIISNTRIDPGWQSWPTGDTDSGHHHIDPGPQNQPTGDVGGGHDRG
jgi:hypothetical protein